MPVEHGPETRTPARVPLPVCRTTRSTKGDALGGFFLPCLPAVPLLLPGICCFFTFLFPSFPSLIIFDPPDVVWHRGPSEDWFRRLRTNKPPPPFPWQRPFSLRGVGGSSFHDAVNKDANSSVFRVGPRFPKCVSFTRIVQARVPPVWSFKD